VKSAKVAVEAACASLIVKEMGVKVTGSKAIVLQNSFAMETTVVWGNTAYMRGIVLSEHLMKRL